MDDSLCPIFACVGECDICVVDGTWLGVVVGVVGLVVGVLVGVLVGVFVGMAKGVLVGADDVVALVFVV